MLSHTQHCSIGLRCACGPRPRVVRASLSPSRPAHFTPAAPFHASFSCRNTDKFAEGGDSEEDEDDEDEEEYESEWLAFILA